MADAMLARDSMKRSIDHKAYDNASMIGFRMKSGL